MKFAAGVGLLAALGVAWTTAPAFHVFAATQDSFAGSSDDAPLIIPRGTDRPVGPIAPSARRSLATNSANPTSNTTARSSSTRGSLRAPDFRSTSPATTASSAIAVGHSGRAPNINRASAAGLDELPFAGGARVDLAAPAQPINDLAAPLIPQDTQPQTPVPSVPDLGQNTFNSPNEFAAPLTDDALSSHGDFVPVQPHSTDAQTLPADAELPSQHPQANTASPMPGHSIRQRGVRPPAPGTSGFRATVESDAPSWIGPYMGRTGMQPDGLEPSPLASPTVVMPADFSAWWDQLVRQQTGLAPTKLNVSVESLAQTALIHAPQVQVLQASPEVQQRIVRQEEAAFDWRTYLDAKYDDLNDPIGNTLTTGNADDRFTDNRFNAEGGLKRRTSTGGELDFGQKVGHQYNNSVFLLPNPQATSRLELSFRQPLLSKAGTVYNQNQIILARINSSISSDESLTELQSHLFSVAESYWKLYRARAEYFQRQKFLTSAQSTLLTLEGRNEVDTIPRQTLRAKAAVARAESRMQRAVTDIRNAESQLRLLVNDPAMLNSGPIELVPTEAPASMPSPTGLRDSLQTALVNRPDISLAIREMRASSVRIGVSKSELLPRLDFLVSSYVAGLENRTQIPESIGNQFTDGRPGFTIGLEFEVPLGNRAAKARLEQRQWELQRAIASFRTTVETSLTEVEIASREVDTAYRDLLGKYQAMVTAQNEVSYLQDRFEQLPQPEDSSILLLEDLLDGYERLADEESAFVSAQASYALSIIQLRRAMGVLLRSRHDAPELEAEESSWMSARADQAASDAGGQQSQLAGLSPFRGIPGQSSEQLATSAPLPEFSSGPPTSWSQPVSTPSRSQPVRNASVSAPQPGHSFGRK